MIGKLKGTVEDKNSQGVLLDTGGVGYDVTVPLSTLASMPVVGRPAELWIHTHVREDDLRLFGFSTKQDRTAFRTMLKISGVGPKLALAVLGSMSSSLLAEVIQTGNAKRLSAIPGIGKKTAERILLELGGKLSLGKEDAQSAQDETLVELSSALKNLGFKSGQVERVLAQFDPKEQQLPFEDMLRTALSLLQGK
jgi:Holliday junction DNA helicase RuvA